MSTHGKTAIVEAIHIAAVKRGPMEAFSEAEAIAGIGLEWDRYGAGHGTYSRWPGDHALTLIEAETLDFLRETYGVSLAPGEHRRNITTRGIRLNKLVGKKFRVGSALCEGAELAHPCAHLEWMTKRPGLVKQMMGRGGLRARILEGGLIHAGDTVSLEPDGQLDLFGEE
jgi:MOSC domain-containing protein YiiM